MPSSITEIPGTASGHNAHPYMETANEPKEIPRLAVLVLLHYNEANEVIYQSNEIFVNPPLN